MIGEKRIGDGEPILRVKQRRRLGRERGRTHARHHPARQFRIGNLTSGTLLEELLEQDRAGQARAARKGGVHLHDDGKHRRLRRSGRGRCERGRVRRREGFGLFGLCGRRGRLGRLRLHHLQKVKADARLAHDPLDGVAGTRVVAHLVSSAPIPAPLAPSLSKAFACAQCARSPHGSRKASSKARRAGVRGRGAYPSNLLVFGKPLGGRRPASARFPIHSLRSALATVKVRPAESRQVRPSAMAKTLASETPPSL